MKRLLVILIVLAFMVPTMATADPQWDMYGSVRMSAIYYDRDEEMTTGILNSGGSDDTDLRMELNNFSRIGAKVKVSDELAGRFEYNSLGELRLLFAEYNFGPGKLLVGQHYRPSFYINSVQVGNSIAGGITEQSNLLGHGAAFNVRDPQIRLTFGNFAVAFVKPENVNGLGAYSRTDTTLPAIDMSYKIKAGPANIQLLAGYQTYDIENADDDTERVDAYLVGGNVKMKFGPSYVNVGGYYGQNPVTYGAVTALGARTGSVPELDSDNNVEDSKGYGGQIVVGMKVNNVLKLEAGYGMTKCKIDDAPGVTEKEDISTSYYFTAPITLAKGVTILPEIGVIDDDEREEGGVKTDEGKAVYYGVCFQMNF